MIQRGFGLGAVLVLLVAGGCARDHVESIQLVRLDSAGQAIVLPVDDSIEGFNRGMFGFNGWMLRWVMRPVTKTFHLIFYPEPVRESFQRAGVNLAFPARLLNNSLQGKWGNAAEETGRFLVNTTIGIAGLFDPATPLGMELHDEDFGQTLGTWGNSPGGAFTFPLGKPTNGRDTIGWLIDYPFDLKNWIPGGGIFFTLNGLTFSIDESLRALGSEADPYATLRDVTALAREYDVRDFEFEWFAGQPDPTIAAALLAPRDPHFFKRAKTRRVRIETTGRKLPYSLWLQRGPAPLVVFIPGFGSSRLSGSTLMIAELLHEAGYSVVTIASTMNPEFIENAASTFVPGYLPRDCGDVQLAVRSIDFQLRERYGERIGPLALAGMSLGGMQTLYMAALDLGLQEGGLNAARYVAIDAPVSTLHALGQIDRYFDAPLDWPADERAEQLEDSLLKVVALTRQPDRLREGLPFSFEESQFLIGYTFHLLMRDALYTSQRLSDRPMLNCNLHSAKRQPCYTRIQQLSFADYVQDIVLPYTLESTPAGVTEEQILNSVSLDAFEPLLSINGRVRAIINDDDFLLRPEDPDWYERVLGERVVRFPAGGHLGNLSQEPVRRAILDAFANLGDSPSAR